MDYLSPPPKGKDLSHLGELINDRSIVEGITSGELHPTLRRPWGEVLPPTYDEHSLRRKNIEDKREEMKQLLQSMVPSMLDAFFNDMATKRREEIEQLRQQDPSDPTVVQFDRYEKEYQEKEAKLQELVDLAAQHGGTKPNKQDTQRWVAAIISFTARMLALML